VAAVVVVERYVCCEGEVGDGIGGCGFGGGGEDGCCACFYAEAQVVERVGDFAVCCCHLERDRRVGRVEDIRFGGWWL
jgi:hypothetical protein